MITEQVKPLATEFRGKLVLPSNVCARCGYVDDPESARSWEEDEDGDRICHACVAISDEERCRDCGSTEAGNCFYCKVD